MSFLQRNTSTASPFAQVYHNTGTFAWGSRPNTATETWLSTTGTNGYSFEGKGFLFGLFVFNGSSVAGWRFGTNVTYASSDFRHAECFAYPNSSKAACDDIAIGYESETSYDDSYYWNSGGKAPMAQFSRINIIRMEGD